MKLGGEESDHNPSHKMVQYQHLKIIFNPLRGWCRFMSISPSYASCTGGYSNLTTSWYTNSFSADSIYSYDLELMAL